MWPSHRPPPYIYSAEEIAALVHAAGTIGAPLPSATLQTLISLIAASGLRLGEALALERGDADPDAAILAVTGKNDQVRMVPLHPTTAGMLAGYAARRDRLCPHPASPAFFITSTGHRAQQRGVQETFARLLALAGIPTPPGRRRPRIHDLRHTFAVTTQVSGVAATASFDKIGKRLPPALQRTGRTAASGVRLVTKRG